MLVQETILKDTMGPQPAGFQTSTTTMSHPSTNCTIPPDFVPANWTWDELSCPSDVQLSDNKQAAYFWVDPVIQSTGTVAVRGSQGFANGEHYWEIVFLEPPSGTSVMVGIGTVEATLQSEQRKFVNLLGKDNESWGLSYKGQIWHGGVSKKYCEPFFARDTTIGIHLNLNEGTLTFYKDGKCMGPAFTGLTASRRRRFFPMVSSTSAETEVGLGARRSKRWQPNALVDDCLQLVRHSVEDDKGVEGLLLPRIFKRHLIGMVQ